jgi:hypothetical protein
MNLKRDSNLLTLSCIVFISPGLSFHQVNQVGT